MAASLFDAEDIWQRYTQWIAAYRAERGETPDWEKLRQCFDEQRFANDDSSWYEARAWMTSGVGSHLAGNRFRTWEEGFAFISRLYELGAEIVFVTSVDCRKITLMHAGGPHADTLVVILPDDRKKRWALLELAAEEAYEGPGEPVMDTGQKQIGFWWD